MDGLGLILFFVPGIVAFAVDFYTGAIYLPFAHSYPGYGASPQNPSTVFPQQVSAHSPNISVRLAAAAGDTETQHQPPWQGFGLKRVAIPPAQLGPQEIEQLVSHHVGKPVSLADGQARMSVLPQINQFAEQISHHQSDPSFGNIARSFTRTGA